MLECKNAAKKIFSSSHYSPYEPSKDWVSHITWRLVSHFSELGRQLYCDHFPALHPPKVFIMQETPITFIKRRLSFQHFVIQYRWWCRLKSVLLCSFISFVVSPSFLWSHRSFSVKIFQRMSLVAEALANNLCTRCKCSLLNLSSMPKVPFSVAIGLPPRFRRSMSWRFILATKPFT